MGVCLAPLPATTETEGIECATVSRSAKASGPSARGDCPGDRAALYEIGSL